MSERPLPRRFVSRTFVRMPAIIDSIRAIHELIERYHTTLGGKIKVDINEVTLRNRRWKCTNRRGNRDEVRQS